MRLVLALLIVVIHTMSVVYGAAYTHEIWTSPIRPLLAVVLPMFFALSGFLVAGSLGRCRSLVSFMGLRVIRIVPALAVDTCVGALLLGPLFTSLPLDEYFGAPTFRSYFLNIIGEIHYSLPGVFESNPWPGSVNLQLWTLPFELMCYLAIAVLAIFRILQRPAIFLGFTIAANLAVFVVYGLMSDTAPTHAVPGLVLLQSFLYGVACFMFRRLIPWNGMLGIAAAIATFIALSIPHGDFLAALPATYLTVYLGLMQPARSRLVTSGDYSYGIFLYGFPIQQAVVVMLGDIGRNPFVNFLVAIPVIVCLAVFSWFVVEKPALKLRPRLIRLEDGLLDFSRTVPGFHWLVPALSEKKA